MEVPEIYLPSEFLRDLVVDGQRFRSSCDFRLTQADLDKARRDLKETEEGRDAALRKFRDMLAKDEDLTYRTDDAFLLRYLRHRKFDCKEAYSKFRSFYMMREEYPELYRIPSNLESLLNLRAGSWLPYTDKEGNYVFIIKLGNWNPSELDIREVLPLFNLICDLATMNPHAQIERVVDIFDLTGTGLGHVSHLLKPTLLRLWLKVMQDVHPWKLKSLIFYNCNAFLYTAIATVKRFLRKKIADRIIVLRSDLSELHEHVNPSILPKLYGGSLDDDQCYSFLNKILLGNTRYLEYEHSFIGSKRQ